MLKSFFVWQYILTWAVLFTSRDCIGTWPGVPPSILSMYYYKIDFRLVEINLFPFISNAREICKLKPLFHNSFVPCYFKLMFRGPGITA